MKMAYKKLGDVCEILDSKRIPITASERKSGQYPYYGANGVQDYVSDFIFDDELVLLAEDGGNFGSKDRPIAYRVSGKCWVNNHAHVLKPLPDIDVDYLCYALMFYDTTGLINGATRQKLTQSAMRQMQIPIRSLDEQKAIVQKISTATGLITLRKTQLQKLDQLASSRFSEMFGRMPRNEKHWTVVTIRDVVTEVRYGSSRPAVENGQYPYLRMNNITYSGELDLSEIKRIDVPDNELSKCTVRRGDVLFNRTNSKELVGKTCVYNRDEMMVLAGFVIRVRLDHEKMLPEFLSAFLNTDFSKQMLLNMCKTAIGQANINAQELQNISVFLPPLQLQKDFVAIKQQLDKSKFELERAISELDATYKRIISENLG